jgi:hypothetical protein
MDHSLLRIFSWRTLGLTALSLTAVHTGTARPYLFTTLLPVLVRMDPEVDFAVNRYVRPRCSVSDPLKSQG